MQGLFKSPGVFVNGSNDYFAPQVRNPLSYLRAPSKRGTNARLDTAALVAGFESAGWLNLNNRGATLNINGLKVGFIGIDDAHDGLDDLGSLAKSLVSAANFDFLLGVSHAPYLKVIDAMGTKKVDLLLAGHTHGGQLCLPFSGAVVTNCDLDRSRAKGASRWGAQTALHVSAGIGTSPFAPFRFCCRPEATLLTLVAAPTGGHDRTRNVMRSTPAVLVR
jgi:predicted MPP superfamily phosphohydrolase